MSSRRLTPDLLIGAYASGIFPMADNREDPTVFWVDPKLRGVLPLDGFRVSRSLARLDTAFEDVLEACADRSETWINETIRSLMIALHKRSEAHSFEVFQDGKLIGGMYGLAIASVFFGESMFSRERDGSKIALAWAVDHLRRTGFTLFDTQFTTPHLVSLGAVEIPREAYHRMLQRALEVDADITRLPLETDPQAVLQRITQTS